MYNIEIKAFSYPSLNSSKGVVRSKELSYCTFEEIKTKQQQNVTDVKRMSRRKDGETIKTCPISWGRRIC